jgi:hypothetical protein
MLVSAMVDAKCTRRVEVLDQARSIENVVVCRPVDNVTVASDGICCSSESLIDGNT